MGLEVIPFRIPMKVTFRGVTHREGILVRGPHGWGEFSPFPDYSGADLVPWAHAAQEAATRPFPTALRTSIPVNTTIPAVSPERAHEMAAASGCTTAKIKVAEGDDEQRVAAVRDALGPHGKIRVDANGGWTLEEAERTLKVLDAYDLEYAEQPVASVEDMAALRKRIDVPLAADESVRRAEDPLRVARLEAADIIVLKVQPLGGVRRCLEIAEACGLPCVVSSAVETSIGIIMGVALAAALPELPYACGLGTVPLLEADVTSDALTPIEGTLAVRRVEPDLIANVTLEGAEGAALIRRFEEAAA